MKEYPLGISTPGSSPGMPQMSGVCTVEAPDVGSPMIDDGGASAVQNILSTGSPISPMTGPAEQTGY